MRSKADAECEAANRIRNAAEYKHRGRPEQAGAELLLEYAPAALGPSVV